MIYKVYLKNYLKGTASFLGALPERRKQTRGAPLIISALKWARLIFGSLVRDARALFIVPIEDEQRQKGASSIEYAFLICLIVVVCILILRFLGESLEGFFKLAAVLIPRR